MLVSKNNGRELDLDLYWSDINKLVSDGVLGFFNKIEVTTVFCCEKNTENICNVLTVLTAEERYEGLREENFLNAKPITIKGLEGLRFGVTQYSIDVVDLVNFCKDINNHKVWRANGKNLNLSNNITAIPRVFVPPDSFEEVPLNKILKNNFFNGSHVFEWFDVSKSNLHFIFNNPEKLQDLSDKICNFVPLNLASLSDRLGNIVLQIPASIVYSKCSPSRDNDKNLIFRSVWHKNIKSLDRRVFINCVTEDDNVYPDFSLVELDESGVTTINMNHSGYSHRYFVWDETNQLILGASRISAFIKEVHVNMMFNSPEPRTFLLSLGSRSKKELRIQVIDCSMFGEDVARVDYKSWIQKRLYTKTKVEAKDRMEFVQYKNEPIQAYEDVRSLISKFGKKSVYLWDPFLSSYDILNTLFYCPYANSKMRAITGLKSDSRDGKSTLYDMYKNELNENCGNKLGLQLEFRAKIGASGFLFHDRFLIFPDEDKGPIAWSLGTSINSLGKAHHIFQKVSDAQMIVDAFNELWNSLDYEENLIWKT